MSENKDKEMKELMKTPEYRKAYAKQYISPLAQNSYAIHSIAHKDEPLDSAALTEELEKQVKAVQDNDLSRMEEMLLCQAHTLDRVFAKLIATGVSAEYLNQFKIKTDIALKAQRQCCATLETLALIKNPQPYVRQQNVAVNQQVNNAAPAPEGTSKNNTRVHAPARGENPEITNGLLEDKSHDLTRLDTGATATAGGGHKTLEAVATLDRRADA